MVKPGWSRGVVKDFVGGGIELLLFLFATIEERAPYVDTS